MTTTAVAPPVEVPADKPLVSLEVDQCPVCLTKDANGRTYVGTNVESGLIDYRRVWLCSSSACAHEWPRYPEDTAK